MADSSKQKTKKQQQKLKKAVPKPQDSPVSAEPQVIPSEGLVIDQPSGLSGLSQS